MAAYAAGAFRDTLTKAYSVALLAVGVLWQSFDHPSDTLLPGMKLGWDLAAGLDRRLTTWRAPGDPSPGDYTFGIDVRGVPEGFIRPAGAAAAAAAAAAPVYRNGPWNGLQFSGEPEMEPNNSNFRFEFVANATDVYYTFLVDDGGGGSVVLSRFMLNQSSVQRYVWPPGGQAWSLYWSLPRDQCDSYAQCGAYGVCDAVGGAPACACVRGFAPASPRAWALRDTSAGCARTTPLNCTGDGFLRLQAVKLPDSMNATADDAITVDQCRQRCLANCSCLAYAASSIKGGDSGCIIWSSLLIDIRRFAYGGEDLYIRLSASDLLRVSKMKLWSSLARWSCSVLLATLAASITYQAGLNPPGGLWQQDHSGAGGLRYKAGDPILLTANPRRYKAFYYFNSVAFVASLVAVALVRRDTLHQHNALEAAMVLDLFGLMGAYAAGSCHDVSTSVYVVALGPSQN